MAEYVMIPKTTLQAYKLSEEHTLDYEEIVKIVANKNVLKKFIEQKAISIQFDIWNGAWAWKEELWLNIIEELAKIAKDIWNIEDTYNKYIEDLAKKNSGDKENEEEKN